MHLIFNELSLSPVAESKYDAEQKFTQLLKTFAKAKEKCEFNHIRFPLNFSELNVIVNQNFIEWLSGLSNSNLKNLLLDICKKPFIDELEESEIDTYFSSNFKILDEECPVNSQPLGLAVAYIKALPTISLDTHNFWRNRLISILKSSDVEEENVRFQVFNISLENDLESEEFDVWKGNYMPEHLVDAEVIRQYLDYHKFKVEFSDNFLDEFIEMKTRDFVQFKHLLLLMKDVQVHPFTGGLGKTENLKDRGKECSKRINHKDRLSYTVNNGVINFLSCSGHYNFH